MRALVSSSCIGFRARIRALACRLLVDAIVADEIFRLHSAEQHFGVFW
jgi:hypothetical protein